MKYKHKRGDERGAVRPTEVREKLRALQGEVELLPPVDKLPKNADWNVRGARLSQVWRLIRECNPLLRNGNDNEQRLARELYDQVWEYGRSKAAWLYPPQWNEAWDALERGEIAKIEPIIEFLEDDPYFIHSGYLKEKLIPRVTRLPREQVPSVWIARLQNGVLNRVRTRWGREFRFYVRLARFVDDAHLRAELEHIAGELYSGPDGEAPARARHILRQLVQ